MYMQACYLFHANSKYRNPFSSGHRRKGVSNMSRIKSATKALAYWLAFLSTNVLFSPITLADTDIGIELTNGERKVTWLGNDLSVSKDNSTATADRWNPEWEEDNLFDYSAYVKNLKLSVMIQHNF